MDPRFRLQASGKASCVGWRFSIVNLSSAAMSYYKPADGNEWLAIGAHGLLLRTKEPAASTQAAQAGSMP